MSKIERKHYLVTGEDVLSGERYSMRLYTTSERCAKELSYGMAVHLHFTDDEQWWMVISCEEV